VRRSFSKAWFVAINNFLTGILNMDQYLKPDYWHAKVAAIFQWFDREIFIDQSLINLIAIFAGIALAWLIARSLKPKLTAIIVERNLAQTPLGRLLHALEQALTYVIAVVLLWLAMAVFQRFGLKVYLLNLFESLLTAWVVIHLITSIVRQAHWARFIAFTAWTVAALHIFSLLDPSLALLDSLAITVGDTRLSILIIIKAVIILSFLMWLAISVSNLFGKRISTIEGMAPSIQILLSKTIAITLMILAVMIAVSSLGIDLSVFAFFGGAVGLGIGFGLQKVISNLFSGLILLLDRSIKPGDVIAIDDTYGQINAMGARYVSIVARDNTEYLVPNEDLITHRVVNWSFSTTLLRLKFSVGVAYGSNIHKVRELMIAEARKIDRVLDDPRPACHLKNFGDNSIELELRFWIRDPENGISNVSSAVRIAIWDAFEANGIKIPFPQRMVHMVAQPAENKIEKI